MRKNRLLRRWTALALTALLALNGLAFADTESYSAGVMRLLNYEGEVRILDATGNDRFIMENVRFSSGESLSTSHGAMASVGLDAAKVLTLDSMTQVLFEKVNHQMKLTLASGRLLLDVQEKLDENEAFEIETSNMTVGIRGTIVFLTSFDGSEEEINKNLLESNETFRELLNRTLPEGYSGNFSQLVVLEGTAVANYRDASGQDQTLDVHAGEKLTILDHPTEIPEILPAAAEDLGADMVERIRSDETLSARVEEASDILQEDPPTEELPAEHVHDFTRQSILPTCTENGTVIYRCACGETFAEDGAAALGHSWGEWQTVAAPTCAAEGSQQRACARCGATEQKTLPAAGHTPITEPATPATCTEPGWTEHIYCSVCEEVLEPYQTEIPALGHDWGEWQTVAAPTCTEPGQREHTCARCNETEQEDVPAAGHNEVTADMPTCTEPGYTGRTVCTVCWQVVSEGTAVPALGGDHDFEPMGDTYTGSYVNGEGITMITLNQDYVCSRCGYGRTVIRDEWESDSNSIDPGD